MNWDETMYSKEIKEALGENYAEEDAMMVIDAIKRTKRIGASNYEQTICLMEKEIRELRNNNEVLKKKIKRSPNRNGRKHRE